MKYTGWCQNDFNGDERGPGLSGSPSGSGSGMAAEASGFLLRFFLARS
jgi:hypothetical protein